MSVIRFYRAREGYGWMSNFRRTPVDLDGRTWPTVEHYYQAMKFDDPLLQEEVRNAPRPHDAAHLGRRKDLPIRADWDSARIDVMRRALWAKFQQHADLRDDLLATGDAEIVEASPWDSFWGEGPDGDGENWLGRVLMETRDRLRQAEPPVS